ncbi:hypothetical protein C5167_039736, partial [Papaver somniferum]
SLKTLLPDTDFSDLSLYGSLIIIFITVYLFKRRYWLCFEEAEKNKVAGCRIQKEATRATKRKVLSVLIPSALAQCIVKDSPLSLDAIFFTGKDRSRLLIRIPLRIADEYTPSLFEIGTTVK